MRLADAPDVLKVDEVAALARMDRKSIYAAIEEGELHAVRRGRSIRVTKPHLLAWLGLTPEDDARAHLRVIDGGGGDG